MSIVVGGIREKLSRRDIYIVSAICVVFVALFSMSNMNFSINGEQVTAYKNLMPILLLIVWGFAGALSIALSLNTIPKEYERGTSHLIWVRGVPQWKYHGSLLGSNAISSYVALFFMYIAFAIFTTIKTGTLSILQMAASFLILALCVTILSALTSVLSIKLPSMVSGLISLSVLLIGTLNPVLNTLANALGGMPAKVLHFLLNLFPNFYALQQQASNILLGKSVDIHVLLGGVFALYIIIQFLFILKRKEA